MQLMELVVLGVALSADAFSVTISNMFSYAGERRSRLYLMPVVFGLFQGLMPVAGYVLGGVAATFIERYAGVVTLLILGCLGGNMIREGVNALRSPAAGPQAADSQDGPAPGRLTVPLLLFQGVATAIDAFAVGVSLRAQGVNLALAALVITLTTFLCCLAGIPLGRRFGELLGDRAQIVGGVVLVAIGVRAFVG